MPSGEFPTGRSAARIGGFTLVGVGVLALFFGVATALTGGSTPSAGSDAPGNAPPPPSSTSTGAAGTSTTVPDTGTSAPSDPETSEPQDSPTSSPSDNPTRDDQRSPGSESRAPDDADSGGDGAGNAAEQVRISLRVYNNSKIDDLAHRAADDLRGAGFEVLEVGNYAGGRIPVTTVYYRPGTDERAEARTVARRLDARLEPRFRGIADASPGVIVIVTKNYDGLG
ncbi:hypothetical protein CDG81_02345 [Actinopolyspora erythraea]|uniref:LytR/CpsA/Psr regulator C-terminal domain-containing protein n=1 Tax=Actinopolyspora erythraea TaxID=414996 RepID=A0A099D282_9ACTN|nr:LytR C-terminal domain-containing protein [Actinopolyspora erythraea]ASU77346.1 hypothetical protein CDG81_02345 [Actinopolyspora erythraea]KGI80164.1 hypothetical protein IL38_18640 [Actinopolyspora erythraea]